MEEAEDENVDDCSDVEEQEISRVLIEEPSPETSIVCTSRVSIKQSPRINVIIMNTHVSVLVDTGATGDIIRLDVCIEMGLRIEPTSHSASQADGESQLNVVGEVHTTMITENNVRLELHAVVVRTLKASVIVSKAFLEHHKVVIDIPCRLVLPDERIIPFADRPGNPKVSLLCADVNCVMFPGESITTPTPTNFLDDDEMAIEPRMESNLSYEPKIVGNSGQLQLTNETDFTVNIKRGQVIGQVRSVCDEGVEINNCDTITPPLKVSTSQPALEPELNKVSIDPQNCVLSSEEINEF